MRDEARKPICFQVPRLSRPLVKGTVSEEALKKMINEIKRLKIHRRRVDMSIEEIANERLQTCEEAIGNEFA